MIQLTHLADMRKSGILLHISSLPSPYGIGTFGKDAFDFIDFLKKAGQTLWQILPLNPTGFGNSPYQSFSAFAGNPYFIDLDLLSKDGLLKVSDYSQIDWGYNPRCVDYGQIYKHRFHILHKACSNFKKTPEYEKFCLNNAFWLDDYALFTALKSSFGESPWYTWPLSLKTKNEQAVESARSLVSDEIENRKIIQYLFFSQWNSLKEYANKNGIEIIGDLPIYVAHDSADVWGNPKQFELDEECNPVFVAGVPPDGFSAEGQLWGNPVFDWEFMRNDGYRWWIRRTEHSLKIYDRIRIDHFRGFSGYYSVPYGMENAVKGIWRKGPGTELFKAIEASLGKPEIIAEDLGFIDEDVLNLLSETGFPGMKVLQFAFDSREGSDYLPHNYDKNCVVYIGTHDNDTLEGWFENADPKDIEFAREYMRIEKNKNRCRAVICTALASVGETVILTMQDLLELGSEAKMNTPSTAENNWQWRALKSDFTNELADEFSHLSKLYGRN